MELLPDFFFNFHVPEFIGVEDLSAIQALYELNIVLAGNDAHSGVFAGRLHWFGIAGWRGLAALIVASGQLRFQGRAQETQRFLCGATLSLPRAATDAAPECLDDNNY